MNTLAGTLASIRPRSPRAARGTSLLEVLVAVTILLLTSLGLAHAYTSAGLAAKVSERDTAAQQAIEQVTDDLGEIPFSQLLAWNGAQRDFGNHSTTLRLRAVTPRLVLVECVATDDTTGAPLASFATYRASEG